jgi:hypothetical protein
MSDFYQQRFERAVSELTIRGINPSLIIPEWEGEKLFWHVWHTPMLTYAKTYFGYQNRVAEIVKAKPPHQWLERITLMQPVKGSDANVLYDYEELKILHDKQCLNCEWDEELELLPQFDKCFGESRNTFAYQTYKLKREFKSFISAVINALKKTDEN